MKKSSGLEVFYNRLRRRITKTRVRVPVIWYRHRGLTDRDAFIAAYPRSGSTWLRFLLLEILSGRPATFDLAHAQIGIVGRHHGNLPLLPNGGRLILTHEPYRREYRKAVYLVRDPRDIVLSEFAFNKAGHQISCDFETFLNWFVRGKANGHGFWANSRALLVGLATGEKGRRADSSIPGNAHRP